MAFRKVAPIHGTLQSAFPTPNPTKPEPKIFVRYSPVIPLISGNPVTNISLIFLDRFVEDFLGNGLSINPWPSQRKIYAYLRCTSGVSGGVAWTKWLMIDLNDHVEGFITPADEKRARVGWIATRIHREEEMVDALRLSTLRPRIGAVVS